MKPLNTITLPVKVGIYDNCSYVIRVYADKITVLEPTIRWIGNTGGYAERKVAIRDPKIVASVLADLADDCETSALQTIGRAIGSYYLGSSI